MAGNIVENVTSFYDTSATSTLKNNNINIDMNSWNAAAVGIFASSSSSSPSDNNYNQGENNINDDKLPGLVSDEALTIFVILNNVILTGVISTIGCIFNVINVIVFCRMGFKDTVNITLMSLAVADFGALLTLVWKAVCFNPYFYNWEEIPFDYQGIQYFTAGWPHVCFARISSLITAFVTFERCLCIAMPLKVRSIITPRRTAVIMSLFFLVIMGSIAPVYFVIGLGSKFFPKRNKTLIGLVYSENGALVEYAILSFNIFVQIFSVVAVIICTIILVVELKQKSSWRAKTSTGAKDSTANVRDVKVVQMVLFISIIFIICFFPSAVNLITMVSEPQYSIRGRYSNLFVLTWAVFNTLESTNSTVNIFVYLKMSSKYAAVFNGMFGDRVSRLCSSSQEKEKELKDN